MTRDIRIGFANSVGNTPLIEIESLSAATGSRSSLQKVESQSSFLMLSAPNLGASSKPSNIALVCIVLGNRQNLVFTVGLSSLSLLIFWLIGSINGRFLPSWTGKPPVI